jgi:hypothetical protein
VVSTQNTKLADKTIDGYPAVLMSMDYLQDTQDVPSFSYVYVIKDGTSLYTLDFWQDQTQGQNIKTNILNNESIFNQILSTFKFTDQQITTSTKHYILKDGKSTVDYPSDWQLTDKTIQQNAELDQNGNPEWSQEVSITKDDYTIYSRNPLAWGPDVCFFADFPKNDSFVGTEYNSYTEFTKNGTIYRRVKTSTAQTQGWTVCSKQSGQNGFGTVSGFGNTTYSTPLQYDEKTLSTMDSILMSMQITN